MLSKEIPVIIERADPTQEAADIRRLAQAAKKTGDQMTKGATIVRAYRLSKEMGFSLENPTVVKILGLDKFLDRDRGSLSESVVKDGDG